MKTTQRPNKFELFAARRPIAFGFVLFFLFTLLSTLTWPISQTLPYPEGNELGEALAKIVITACFVGLLWRFGWLKFAGFNNLGTKQAWLIAVPLMFYKAILSVYVFAGKFIFQFPPLADTLGIIFFSLATSLLEESMYRGLLLSAMRKAWDSTRRGMIFSALISGLFWGSMHFFNLLIRPFPVVFLQVLNMVLIGFFYGILVFYSRSIWPAVLFHWTTNAAVELALSNVTNFEETLAHWVGYTAVSLLPVLVSLWLLKTSSQTEQGLTTGFSTSTQLIE